MASMLESAKHLAAIMADPDKFLQDLMAQLGFNPQEFMDELQGFKMGMQQTILHFNAALIRIEGQQAAILDALNELRAAQTARLEAPVTLEVKPNGHDKQ